ncbi:MAG: hypothetical protein JKY84_14290 [Emcibacteraceae bacterium]|nr:hypothetical protein [Emcibacteraceae bacterium]
MTNDKPDINVDTSGKLSARMSVFAWIICAVLGWALAFTSFTSITGDEEDVVITAQTEPNAEDAIRMEQVLPAAGDTQPNQ